MKAYVIGIITICIHKLWT